MRTKRPPCVATWLLQHLASDNVPLAGDLLEEFRAGRTAHWYWRQVMAAIFRDMLDRIWAHKTLGLLALAVAGAFWLGNNIPAPGDNLAILLTRGQTGGDLALYDLLTGGNLGRATFFALGIMPYMSALTIRWIMLFIWPSLNRRSQDEGRGRRRDLSWARYGAIVLCIVQASAIAVWLERQTNVAGGLPRGNEPGWTFRLTMVLTLTATTACLIWLSEQITKRGIGWATSLVFFAAMVVGVPGAVAAALDQMPAGQGGLLELSALALRLLVASGLMWLVEPGRRRFPRMT